MRHHNEFRNYSIIARCRGDVAAPVGRRGARGSGRSLLVVKMGRRQHSIDMSDGVP